MKSLSLLIISVTFVTLFDMNNGCGAGLGRGKKGLLQKCFGKNVQGGSRVSSSQPRADSTNALNCNFDGPCQCWSSTGSVPWNYASGAYDDKAIKKCFSKAGSSSGGFSPSGGFAYAEASDTQSTGEAVLVSCRLNNVKDLKMNYDWWTSNGIISACTRINGNENCQQMLPGENMKVLIERSNTVHDTVELFVLGHNYGPKGGIVALDNIAVTGETLPQELDRPDSSLYSCTGPSDPCLPYSFDNFKEVNEFFGSFDNGIPDRTDTADAGHWATQLKPGEKAIVRFSKHSSDPGTALNGVLEYDAYQSTDNMFVKFCEDEQLTNCQVHYGQAEATTKNLEWTKQSGSIQSKSDVWVVCENTGTNIGFCGVDNFVFKPQF